MEILQNYLSSVSLFLTEIIKYFSNLTGFNYYTSQIVLIALVIYVFFIIVLLLIHKIFIRIGKKLTANCNIKYDEIWYLVSLNMYDFSQQAKSQGKENQLIYGARSIISLEKNDYISNRKKIFQDITKLESYIGKKIISEELIYQINGLHKKLKNNSFFQEMIGRILTILTLGIYWLVR